MSLLVICYETLTIVLCQINIFELVQDTIKYSNTVRLVKEKENVKEEDHLGYNLSPL